MVSQGASDTVVDSSSVKVGFKLRVDELRVAPIKPLIQFFSLLGRKRVYGPFDFLYA